MIREERRLAERLLRLTKESRIPWRRSDGDTWMYEFSLGQYTFLLEGRTESEGGTLLTIRYNVKPSLIKDIVIQGFLVEQLYEDVYELERAWLQSSSQSGKQKAGPDEKEKARREMLRGALRLLGELAR